MKRSEEYYEGDQDEVLSTNVRGEVMQDVMNRRLSRRSMMRAGDTVAIFIKSEVILALIFKVGLSFCLSREFIARRGVCVEACRGACSQKSHGEGESEESSEHDDGKAANNLHRGLR